MPEEIVTLDSMDGSEFEHLCGRLLHTLGYGRVEDIRNVANGGRDLIVHSSKGKIVVECKHQPKSAVGRPVVQKLHSAVITESATKGMLITTGKFTNAAIEYAKKIDVELVDFSILSAMATRVGMTLRLNGGSMQAITLPYSDLFIAQLKPQMNLKVPVESHPKKWEELSEIILESLDITPTYLVRYSIQETFSTTIGVIHSIDAKDQSLLVDTLRNIILPDVFAKFVKNCVFAKDPRVRIDASVTINTIIRDRVTTENFPNKLSTYSHKQVQHEPLPPRVSGPISSTEFNMDEMSLKNFVVSYLIQSYTQTVTYYGRNNVAYQKTCVPPKRSVRVEGITPLYLPVWNGHLRTLTKNYDLKGVQSSPDSTFDLSSISCGICRTESDKSGYQLCNMCGILTHSRQSKSRSITCSFVCKICATTLCQRCANRQRRFLIFTRYLCRNCAEGQGINTKEEESFRDVMRGREGNLSKVRVHGPNA